MAYFFCAIFLFFCKFQLNLFVLNSQGFQRVYEDMPDIVLDIPLAYIMLDRFIERCGRAGFLSELSIKNMPSRFVSNSLQHLHSFIQLK